MNLKVMTMNLRVHTSYDGENAWPNRIESAADVFHTHQPLVAGTQEGLATMLSSLSEQLPDYAWIGHGRLGDHEDEHCAIFYRKDAVQLQDSGQFWLSETPEQQASVSWDSACVRICTWADFTLKEDPSVTFTFFNTHLDHVSQQAREQGAKLICQRMAQKRAAGAHTLILTGDMNAEPTNAVIQFFRGAQQIDGETTDLVDAYSASNEPVKHTFHGFHDEGVTIDYIFTTPNVTINNVKVDQENHLGRLPSDHFPVIASLEL